MCTVQKYCFLQVVKQSIRYCKKFRCYWRKSCRKLFCARVFAGMCSYLFFCKEWFLTLFFATAVSWTSKTIWILSDLNQCIHFAYVFGKNMRPVCGCSPKQSAHCGGCLARVHGDNIATPPRLIVTRRILFMAARHNQWRQRLLKPGGRVWFQCRSYLYCLSAIENPHLWSSKNLYNYGAQ